MGLPSGGWRASVRATSARSARGLSFPQMTAAGAIAAETSVPGPSVGAARAFATRLPVVTGMLVLAATYYAAAEIGYELEFSGPIGAVVWLPVGVGIAFLYFGGAGLWPGLVLGDLLANQYSALPLGSAIGQTFGNVLEVVVATLLLHRLVPRASPLAGLGGLLRMLVAIAAGTAISATIGLLSLRAGGAVSTAELPGVWRTWWLGDSTGALIVVPLALAWWPPQPLHVRTRKVEAVVMLVALAAASEFASRSEGPWTYLAFAALLWAGLRFGQRGATLATVIVVGFSVWNTMHYDGPFASDSLTQSILSTQLFIAVAALSTLCLAAVVAERERIAEQLGASRARLIDAADTERRRIERNLHDGAQQRLVALAARFRLATEQVGRCPEQASALLGDAASELQLALGELRELAHGIHPTVLSQLGLPDAIRSLVAGATVPTRILELPSSRLGEASEAAAYYVVAEALANAQKHAGATLVHVGARSWHGLLTVDVWDDGRGGAIEGAGTGLLGLRDRVEAAGGSFDLDSPAGHGTHVRAEIPA